MELKIVPKAEGTTLTVELTGFFGMTQAKEFDEMFPKMARGMKEVRLDFSGVTYICSRGLHSLFQAKKTMTKQDGVLKVLNPSAVVREVFQATSYDTIVTVVQREEAGETAAPLFYPLRPIQRGMVDSHFLHARSTMMNTGAFFRLDPSIDLDILATVVNDMLAAYDIFRCRLVFHPETGDMCQRFDGDLPKVRVETMSDESFEKRRQEMKQPYDLIDHPLYRIYIMHTPSSNYLYLDFYHGIMDGTAISLLFCGEMDKRYTRMVRGKEAKERQASGYIDYIREEAQISPAALAEGHEYWRKMVEGFDSAKHLPPADVSGKPDSPEHEMDVPLQKIEKAFFKGKDFNENTFFMAVTMLALAKTSGRKEAIMAWVHNGRFTFQERRLMGLMLEQFPIRWDFDRDISAAEFLQGLGEKIEESMKYRRSMDIVYGELLLYDIPCFLLQKGNMGRRGVLKICGTEALIEELPANEISAVENSMDIELNAQDDGTYFLVLDYDNSRYSEQSMRRFARLFEQMAYGLQDGQASVMALLER